MQVARPSVSESGPCKLCNLLRNALELTPLAVYFEVFLSNHDNYRLLSFFFCFLSRFSENLHTVTQFVLVLAIILSVSVKSEMDIRAHGRAPEHALLSSFSHRPPGYL